jgi:hypothetical protein
LIFYRHLIISLNQNNGLQEFIVAFMLEHYFCLVEFKSVFEFNCLNSFEKWPKHFLFLTHPFLCFRPNSAARPTRSPPRLKLARTASLLLQPLPSGARRSSLTSDRT